MFPHGVSAQCQVGNYVGARPPLTLRRGGELLVGEAVDSGQEHVGLTGQAVQVGGQKGSGLDHASILVGARLPR